MTSTREAVEAAIVSVSLGSFLAYHIWLFCLRGKGYKVQPKYHDFFAAGKLARSVWAEACATDEKDAILGVQQARNAMTACTYLATISVALATAGITVIFDQSKIDRIRQLAVDDIIMKNLEGQPLVTPTVILALALGSLYASFVCFAQSVRLYVHTGFYIRACTSRYNPGTLRVAEAKRVTIHAGVAFSVGLRLFYLFIPLVMWSIGVTALLISSIVMTLLIAYMDHFDMADYSNTHLDQSDDEESLQLTAPAAGTLQLTATAKPNDALPNDTHQATDNRQQQQQDGNGQATAFAAAAAAGGPAAHSNLNEAGKQTFAGSARHSKVSSPSRQHSAAQDLGEEYVASMV